MTKLVECVPNISEGRNLHIIEALVRVIKDVNRVVLLDRHVDADHHRTVLTMAGEPDAVQTAICRLVQTASQIIDLSQHHGVHPRVGAVDVVPFIPLRDIEMKECVDMARQVGKRIGKTLNIPVFLYADASSSFPPRLLESIRQNGLRGLEGRMTSEPGWLPDYGPTNLHPTAGAVAIGARDFLIAYNVVLQTDDVSIARAIARRIRTSGGGLPALKAMGVPLKSRGLTQVSMNLTNYHVTSLYDVYGMIQKETEQYRFDIEESELVGLVPRAAIPEEWISLLKFKRWNPDQILETRLSQTGLE